MLARQQIGKLVVVALRQFEELHHHAGAALRIGGAPLRLRRLGILDRGAHFRLRGQIHLGLDLAGHRLKHVRAPPRRALDLTFADKVSDRAHAFLQGLSGQVLAASCSLYSVWKGFPRAAHLRKCGPFPHAHPTNVVWDYRPAYQCRAIVAAFLAADFFAARFGDALPSTASRPAPRISSENCPLPATRASTIVPIMLAMIPIACLRAALRGRSGICAASASIICSSLAANALRVLGFSRAISAASVGTAQPRPGSSRCSGVR